MGARIDSLINGQIERGRIAGASVAVVKGTDTIRMRGYGKADLDLDVATPEQGIYEIGSVTKQFTAAALMQLVEQGKVGLDDDITKYLPTYPTQGNQIAVRRLLDHTSGIRGYTEIVEARRFFQIKYPKDSVVALFASKPFDFPTGERLVYNNSGYFLLGLIIENVSGQSYGDYVRKRIFEPLGMGRSSYCSETAVVKGRVHGYSYVSNGLIHAFQSDHSWPYAAGSLCSTAGDLITWLRALHHGDRVISRDAYRQMTSPGKLNDGTQVRYAMGLSVVEEAGRRMISHGGGISGFVSETRYYPGDDLYVVLLINTAGGADASDGARNIAEIVLGPSKEAPGQAFTGDLSPFAGTYRGVGRGLPIQLAVAVEGGRLVARIGPQQNPRPLRYLGGNRFAGPGRDWYTFVRDGDRVTAVQLDQVSVVSRLDRVP
jgi:CubicO group peptidase (beta-lactamase class C family)